MGTEPTYEKTPDPNIIRRTRVVVDEIHLDGLRRRIEILKMRLNTGEGLEKWYRDKLIRYQSLLEKLEKL